MIKLKLKLKGDAEKKFQEMINWSESDEREIVLDALALLYHGMKGVRTRQNIGILNPQNREFTSIALLTLNQCKQKAARSN